MKKLYVIVPTIIVVLITIGISFFLIRDATATIPDELTFVTSEGEKYNFGEADKKLKLIEFMYGNCPDICPTTTQKMTLLKKDLQKAGVFGDKVQFVTITIDPYNDTPEQISKYRDNFDIKNDGNWFFLTGDKNNIEKSRENLETITDTFNFQYRDPGNGYYIHSSLIFLVDENNQFIKKFPMGEEFNKDDVYDTIMNEI